MTQTNVHSKRTRKVRSKSAHRGDDAGAVHVYPTLSPPAASAPAAPAAAPAKASGGAMRFVGRAMGLG